MFKLSFWSKEQGTKIVDGELPIVNSVPVEVAKKALEAGMPQEMLATEMINRWYRRRDDIIIHGT